MPQYFPVIHLHKLWTTLPISEDHCILEYHEDGGSTLWRNVGKGLPDRMVPHPKDSNLHRHGSEDFTHDENWVRDIPLREHSRYTIFENFGTLSFCRYSSS
jgi:hypothetical protein